MKKLDKLLISSFIGPFILTFFIVIFVLALQFLWVYIDELVGKGLGLGVIFEFLGWASATLTPMALPLATLLASIMSLGSLGENNELLAMKAAGISLKRIFVPLIGVSAFIVVGAFFASNNLIPVAYNKIYTLREDIIKAKETIKIPVGTFYDGIDGYILRIEHRNDETGKLYNLIIYDHSGNNGNTNMTLADSGLIHITPDDKNLIFDLYHGCSYVESNLMTYRDTSIELQRLKFDQQQLIVPLENYTFSRTDDDRFSDEVMSKDLQALRHDRDSLSTVFDTLRGLQYKRLVSGAGLEYLHQLDTSRNKVIKGNINLDTLYANLDTEHELQACRQAINSVAIATEQINTYKNEDWRYIDPLRRIDIESYRKFTLSLACLIFFFIGAPLGAIIRKGGLGTPVIISILFFLIYYIIDMIGKKLARDGAVSPFTGTIVSSLILLPLGVFLTWKSTKDSNLFSMDSYTLFFKNVGKGVVKGYRSVRNVFRRRGGRVRIVYMGTPEFAVGPLSMLIENKYEIAAVVTVPDKPSGRGLKVNESDVKKYAVSQNIPVMQPVSLKDPEFLAQLKAIDADLFIVVAFRMLPKEVWSMPRMGTFNLHASLLPRYRGAAPINWAIINGEKVTGVTTFLIDEQIDTGRILFQTQCPIDNYETAGSLHDKLMALGSELVVKTTEAFVNHNVKSYLQENFAAVKPAPKITREICHIDWTQNARDVDALIRGLSPYPAAYTSIVSGEEVSNVKIYDSYVVESIDNDLPAGTITTDGKTFIEVKCGSRSIRIENIQVAGKKRLFTKDFLLGFRDLEKYKFV